MTISNNYSPNVRPGMVTTIALMALVSGIVNLIWGLIMGGSLLISIILACIAPLGLLPIVLGVFEIIYAAKLLANPPQRAQPSTAIAIFEICTLLVGNVFSAVVGILSLVFYNDPQVKDYFARLNGFVAPAAAPAAPAQQLIPEAAPAPPSGTLPAMDESPAPEPKPRGRKVADNPEKSD